MGERTVYREFLADAVTLLGFRVRDSGTNGVVAADVVSAVIEREDDFKRGSR